MGIVPYIGDTESTTAKLVKMASKSDKMMLDAFEMVAKSDKLRPLLIKAIDSVTGGKATTFISKGAKEEDIIHIAANRGNFKKMFGIVRDNTLKQIRWLEEGTSTWGWTKIKEVHWNDIINVFGPKTELEVQEMILKTLKNGKLTKSILNNQYRYTTEFLGKDGKLQNFHVVVSDRSLEIGGIGKGNVVTAFPEIIS